MRLFRRRERPPVDPMLQALNDECARWGDVLWYNRNRKGSEEARRAFDWAVEADARRRAYLVEKESKEPLDARL